MNETSLAGCYGLAASVIAYCKESFSLREYSDCSSASTNRLATEVVLRDPKANLSPSLCIESSICRYDVLAEQYIMQPKSNFYLTRDGLSFRSVVRSAPQEVWEKTFKRFNAFKHLAFEIFNIRLNLRLRKYSPK